MSRWEGAGSLAAAVRVGASRCPLACSDCRAVPPWRSPPVAVEGDGGCSMGAALDVSAASGLLDSSGCAGPSGTSLAS